MSDDQFVSLSTTVIWAVAFVIAVWVIARSFGFLILRSIDEEARQRRQQESRGHTRATNIR